MSRRARAALPAARSSFVGRAAELRAVIDAFAGGTRLLTLVGLGGTGKTRLALEAARVLAREHPLEGGEHFCDLSHARGEDDVCRAVASSLGVALERGAGAALLLARALAARPPTLLVLDNFEQIVAVAPATAGAWLDAAPELRLLVTSREPLRLQGETLLEVLPLPTVHGSEGRSDAAELFVERARALRAGAAVECEPSVIDRIVEALDGLPLAIELAAARLAVLSPGELLELLPRPFELLTRGARDLPDRQSSLERALDWSWDRLDDHERAAFAQCSVFHGGFTRDAAEAVLEPAPAGAGERAPSTLDLLQSLREKSLLVVDASRSDQPPRFAMLATVRAYAEVRLRAAGGYRAARARHAAHYLQRARAAAAGLSGLESRRHLAALTAELDNLAAIVDGAAEGGDEAALALSVLLALEPFFDLRGPAFDALPRLDAALEAMAGEQSAPSSSELLGEARRLRGKLRRMHAMLGPAVEDIEVALACARARADRVAEGRALVDLGLVHRAAGRSPEVERTAVSSVALLESAGAPPALLAFARGLVAIGAHSQGRLEEARPVYRRALDELAAAGDRRAEGVLLGSYGFLCQDLGDLDEAERQYQRALEIHRDLGNRRSEGVVLGYLGNVQRSRRDLEGALSRYADATALLREQGDEQFEGVFYMDWGILLLDHGRPDEAIAQFEEALVHLGRAGDVRCAALVLGHLGAVYAAASRIAEAERCFDEAAAKLRVSGDPHFGQVVAVLAGQLDVARTLSARASGRTGEADRALEAARARLDAAERVQRPSEHVLFARRRLQRALDAAEPPADALVVAPDASWFRAPHATPSDLTTRPPLRNMLGALADARLRAPGEALAADALFAAGWPGERIQRGAMHNRVRVALSTLRKLGLAAALVRSEGGWLLDPAVPLVLAARTP
jgi:predicted ATPase